MGAYCTVTRLRRVPRLIGLRINISTFRLLGWGFKCFTKFCVFERGLFALGVRGWGLGPSRMLALGWGPGSAG